jgi:SpoVK/Ycf46/Vps4 family AAA+-type ATPase
MEFGYEEKQKRKDRIINFFLSLAGGIIGTFAVILFIGFLGFLVGPSGGNIDSNNITNEEFRELSKELKKELKKELEGEGVKEKVLTEVEKEDADDNWVENQVLQKEVGEELKIWLNSFKLLPLFQNENSGGVNKHVLFYGPAGSGKSYVARLLGEKESLAYGFFHFGLDTFVGTSKMKIDSAFQKAKKILTKENKKPENERSNKPIFIIIDEIDSVGVKDFSFGSNSKNEPINRLLTLVDDIEREKLNIIIIGITNYCEVLESALIRSGRLGNKVKFDYPNKEELKKSVQILKEKVTEKKYSYKKYDDNNKEAKGVRWTDDFWEGVENIIVNQEKGQFNLIDMELAIQRTLAKECEREKNVIEPTAGEYRKELEKLSKIKNIKNKGNGKQKEIMRKEQGEILLAKFSEFILSEKAKESSNSD